MASKVEMATKELLEKREAANIIKISALETENKALVSRITVLESNKSSNVLDFSKLFERKGTKSIGEILK